ncbi:MAG TPA: response regulator [Candidatus Methylomirabilis sp.]|nr:response regulator [Candidatus Methylomirabilis sp.]
MKLLIVEDEEILYKVLHEKFSRQDFKVELAMDGEAAISLAKSFRPDVILLDIILPKKDGITVLRELKADPDLSNIPVIISSNLGDDEKIKTALGLGAVDYLIKAQHPINEIVDIVKKYAESPK